MNRTEWAVQLAEVIRPTAAKAAATQIGQLMRYMADVPAEAFTEQSVLFVAARKGAHSLSLMWLRGVLQDYLAEAAPPTPPAPADDPNAKLWREREEAADFYRRDWDDASGILRKVQQHQDSPANLRLLAVLVGKWAPQHIGLIPPATLEEVARDPRSWLPVFVSMRKQLEDQPPPINTIGYTGIRAIPNYLDPEYLDRINPLPNGRKRHATNDTTPSANAHSDTTPPLDGRNPYGSAYPDHSPC